MKRFLVFRCDDHYPAGGWNDFIGDTDTVENAKRLLAGGKSNIEVDGHFHIVDTEGLIPRVIIWGSVLIIFRENGEKHIEFEEAPHDDDEPNPLH